MGMKYKRSKCTIRWIKLGGENTKFFHAKATERFRHNSIVSIKDEDGTILTEHHEKANAFWHSFKNRMGVSFPPNSPFQLQNVLKPIDNLESLVQPFSEDEISNIVKHMKPDRAPGPDGFNGLFLQKCWQIIKGDFINLCQDFHHGHVSLQSINGSFITLVPKNNSPEFITLSAYGMHGRWVFMVTSIIWTCWRYYRAPVEIWV
jgi:hypothetical protein